MNIARTVLLLVTSLAVTTLTFATPDPDDPLNKPDLLCNTNDLHSFCNGPFTNTYNPNSCFERVATSGCKIMMKDSPALCHWRFIYGGLQSFKAKTLCTHEYNWCTNKNLNHQKAFTDCQLVFERCVKYNTLAQAPQPNGCGA